MHPAAAAAPLSSGTVVDLWVLLKSCCSYVFMLLLFVALQAQHAVFSSSNVAAAYAFAARAHAGQARKNGEPVLSHLVATACILAELGLPEEVVAAGLLHDVLCDTATTAAQLSAVLPASVVGLVSRVSQLNQLSQNYRDNTHSLEAEAMLDMLTGACKSRGAVWQHGLSSLEGGGCTECE